jgi:hypothetical protein
MALVVEDGTGKSDAEAYDTIANISTYLTKYGEETTFDGLASDELREEATREGARYLDAVYGVRWLGTRTNETQALDWPRSGVYDYDGFLIDGSTMPQALLDAQAIAADRAAAGDDLMPDVTNPGTLKSKRSKVGELEVEKEWIGGQGMFKKYSLIEKLLAPLVASRHSVGLS